MKIKSITPVFVDAIPDTLEDGVLYVSERYGTAIHRCCCGCGEEVVTPLSPAEWSVKRSGSSVSLTPSIGNWSFACRSHYWIRGNRVFAAASMTDRQIAAVKRRDMVDKAAYIHRVNQQKSWSLNGVWSALVRWWRSLQS